jgi:hypothetical protein
MRRRSCPIPRARAGVGVGVAPSVLGGRDTQPKSRGRCWIGQGRPGTNGCGPSSGTGTPHLAACSPGLGSPRRTARKCTPSTGLNCSRRDGFDNLRPIIGYSVRCRRVRWSAHQPRSHQRPPRRHRRRAVSILIKDGDQPSGCCRAQQDPLDYRVSRGSWLDQPGQQGGGFTCLHAAGWSSSGLGSVLYQFANEPPPASYAVWTRCHGSLGLVQMAVYGPYCFVTRHRPAYGLPSPRSTRRPCPWLLPS